MDKISHALQKARSTHSRTPIKRSAALEHEVEYTNTRHVTVDAETLRRRRIIAGIDDRRVIDAYKVLRTRVMRRMEQNNWRTLGITSTGENEGKSLTAANLAIAIAMKFNYTVLLVDADLRRPSTHTLFGFEPEYGLSDYLLRDVSVEHILVHPQIPRLVLLPGNQGAADSSELLASPRMTELVEELKTRYPSRLVLFDLPPVLVGDDVAAFAPQLDTTMVVVEDNATQADQLARTLDLLEGVEVLGTVLNKASERGRGYDYYYYQYGPSQDT